MKRRRLIISANDNPPKKRIMFSQMRCLSENQYCIGYSDVDGNEIDFPYTPEDPVEEKEIYYPDDFNWTPVLVDEITSIKQTIKYLEIPPSVTILPCDFDSSVNAHAIKAVVFPQTFTEIPDFTFRDTGLSDMNMLPASLSRIGTDRVFEGCPIKAFEIDENNNTFCTVDGIIYNVEKTQIVAYPSGRVKKSFEIPQGITRSNPWIFSKSTLKEVTLPQSLDSLGFYMFANISLDKIIAKNPNPPSANQYAFQYFLGVSKIIVPKGRLNFYKTKANWSAYASVMVEEE